MNVLIELLTTLFGKSPVHLAPLLDECQDEYCDSLIEHETVSSSPVEAVSCELVI